MIQMTHLSHSLEKTEYAARYDAAAKKLVSDKQECCQNSWIRNSLLITTMI